MEALRRLAFAALCLAASACDSEAPVDVPAQPAIVGSWAIQSYTTDTYATVSQTQRALDLFSPATGSLTVEGTVSASIRYLNRRYSDATGDGTLTGYSLSSEPESLPGIRSVSLGVARAGTVVAVRDERGDETRSFYLESGAEPTPYSAGNDTLRFARSRHVDFPPGNGEVVFVEGTLVLARKTLEARREYLLSRRARDRDGRPFRGVTRTFLPDGTYRETDSGVAPFGGKWKTTA